MKVEECTKKAEAAEERNAELRGLSGGTELYEYFAVVITFREMFEAWTF